MFLKNREKDNNPMPSSKEEKEFVEYVVDLMQSLGPVCAKGMFGGYGIFLEGLMFALVDDCTLYFKADKETEKEFTKRRLPAFSYYKEGKELKLSYFEAPDDVLEDSDEMNRWASQAYEVALRVAASKKGK